MPPISRPELVLYACIARKTTILAEFNRDQPDLPPLALKCIELMLPHHSIFSQTHRQRTYTFLIDDPFVYFGVFNDALSNSEGLHFLGKVKVAFLELIRNGSIKNSGNLGPSPGLQAPFDAILNRLMQSGYDLESVSSPRSDNMKANGSDPLNGGSNLASQVIESPGKGLKKKRRFNGDAVNSGVSDRIISKDTDLESKVDIRHETYGLVPRTSSYPCSDRQKAKRVWKKHVWVVLLLDLFVCVILFGVWLWVCRGFQCIDG